MKIDVLQALACSLIVLSNVVALIPLNRLQQGSESGRTLEIIQAQVPPRRTFDNSSCTQTIFNHVFADSYGIPYVGIYRPPVDCQFTTTIFNLSVTISGVQFDRLALLFFGNTEIWRMSTALPVGDSIYWSYQKDMTKFDTLLKEEQKVIFDLNNVLDERLDGVFDVTLKAIYFDDEYEDFQPADLIYAISAQAAYQNISSVFSLPKDNGTVSMSFPRNVKNAVVSLIASGNSEEEFWYLNVPSDYANTFPSDSGGLPGHSPFREIELLIDGHLAGISWPFPLMFSGGLDPALWRPFVGIDAYDLPTFEIDITPWLPLLCDGKHHTFGLKVVGYDSLAQDNIGKVGENWYATGSVFVWLDKTGKSTTGSIIESHSPAPSFSFLPEVTTMVINGTTTNTTLYFELSAQRHLSISSIIHTSSGSKNVSWTQSLFFTNTQNMTSDANIQSLAMTSFGTFSNSFSDTKSHYSYPVNFSFTYNPAPSPLTLSSIYFLVDRGLLISGIDTLPYLTGTSTGAETLATRQIASTEYHFNETVMHDGLITETGTTEQWFSFSGRSGNVNYGVDRFSRRLKEVDDYITVDEQGWTTVNVPGFEALPKVGGEPAA